MNRKSLVLVVAALCGLFTPIHSASAQGTAFTYQGQLQSGGSPPTGNYDFTFALYGTNNTNGDQIGSTLTNLDVSVTNGLFTVALDFGAVFNGNNVWLAIEVRTNGASGFTALNPLQALTPTPYAIYAPNSGTAANVTGAITLTQLPGAVVTNGESGVDVTGTFTGDGSGSSNVTASALATPVGQTNFYSSSGTNSFTVPAGATSMVAKLWGAGGGGAVDTGGGGGAFSEVTLNVTPGQTYYVVVGQPGSYASAGGAGGGTGANDASGGAGSSLSGGGGQASSLFLYTGSDYITEAVAGGGGGGGSGYGANAGLATAGSGAAYASGATTTGETSLNLMGGDGAAGASFDGGCGGGYGGGVLSGDGQANGGGSFGTTTTGGSGSSPGNTSDPNYISGAAAGGSSFTGGANGLAVVIFPSALSIPTAVQAVSFAGDGSGLTSLNASQLTSGTIPAAQLPGTVALLNVNQTFTGQNNFSSTVGIGTTSPTQATLCVNGSANTLRNSYTYYALSGYDMTATAGTTTPYSIWCSARIMATEFDAYSDARVKHILGRSSSATDLQTLLGLNVTDYSYIDTVAKGSGPQKKVIAQEVEKVFPQAVSKHTDVVPDIYQKASIKDGWVQLSTNLKKGERVKLIGEKEQGVHEVLEVRDGAFRTDFKPAGGKVFVYGREVNDFRTVDYEAIAMLNVSATQELAKDNAALKARVESLEAREKHVANLEQKVAELEKLVAQLGQVGKGANVAVQPSSTNPNQ